MKQIMVQVPVVEMVKAALLPIPTVLGRAREAAVRNHPLLAGGFTREDCQKLLDAGLSWFVDGVLLNQFPYAATVLTPPETFEFGGPVLWSNANMATVHYTGRLPDFVLDRLEQAAALEVKYATLHSLMPLPVSYRHTDPVLVGWKANPHISVWNKSQCQPHLCGVVLSIWGEELRELS